MLVILMLVILNTGYADADLCIGIVFLVCMAELLNIVDTIQNTSNNQSITENTRLIDWLMFYTVSIVMYTNGDKSYMYRIGLVIT